METRLITIFGVLISVLLIAILAVVVNMTVSGPVQAQPTGGTIGRQVTVVGQGEVTGVPDTAYVQIGVETEAATTNEALAQNNTNTQAIIDKLLELGVAEKDIQTSNFSINPRYDNDGRVITGYVVNNMVAVTIRDLNQAGSLLDQVVQVGANRVYGINFGVDDPTALLDQAREKAVANARTRAEQLATASGNSLGEVIVISENIGSTPVPMPLGRGMAEDMAASVPIQTGEQTFSAQVQITFALQ